MIPWDTLYLYPNLVALLFSLLRYIPLIPPCVSFSCFPFLCFAVSIPQTESIDLPPAWRLMKAFPFHSFTTYDALALALAMALAENDMTR